MLQSELFNYPFQANVWGTFSDWVMVIVTALTAVYLIKTFRSQKEVQLLQIKATTIENERYRLENLPIFKLETIVGDLDNTGPLFKQHLTLRFTLLNCDVKYCGLAISSPNTTLVANDNNVLSAKNISKDSIHELSFYLKANKSNYDDNGFLLNIKISYIDPVGNRYHQNCRVLLQYSNIEVNTDAVPTYDYYS